MTQLEEIRELVAKNEAEARTLAKNIWDYAELPYCEVRSSAALCQALENQGFTIKTNIAGMPTAFTATYKYGSGSPIMALLAEYDALDGLSQKAACSVQDPVVPGAPGHGCGHNLLGGGCYAAAVAVKEYLQTHKKDGTIIFFGCPAEEGAGSKQFIAREGYFDNVDFAYTWHPGTLNIIPSKGSVAIMGANFIFDGVASHAGGSPHLGRSALDAVELMNVGVNYLREHMIDSARIHYAYSDAGGTAPNVVQSHAVIKYEVRSPKVAQMQELFNRVADVAKGAALMTGTKMRYEITMAFSDYLPNKTLAGMVDQCYAEVGAPKWEEKDYEMAAEFLRTYSRGAVKDIKSELALANLFDEDELDDLMQKPLDPKVHPFDYREIGYSSGSTDVGDVGYAVPTVMLYTAVACVGNVAHSWQRTAFCGSEIGMKGMMTAAEVMALACIRTMDDPELIEKAKKELLKKNGGKYVCPLPDYVTPPIGRY